MRGRPLAALRLAPALFAFQAAAAQSVGSPPATNFAFRDLNVAFALPPLKDAANGPVESSGAMGLQVLARARRLGLGGRSATEAWRRAGVRFDQMRETVAAARRTPTAEAVFTGARASELNLVLHRPGSRAVRVASARLVLDAPVCLDRSDLRLDLARAELVGADPAQPYLVRIEHARNVVLVGGVFTGKGNGVLVSASNGVSIVDGHFTALSGSGVVATNARQVAIWGNRLQGLGRAPIMLHGATRQAVVAENTIENNLGASNWHAGVVVTDRNVDLAANPLSLFRPDHYGVVDEPITGRLTIPRDNLIVFNRIARNRASGLYFDGAVENVVASNFIEGNAKEGMCLDNGSTANVVALNTISQNGKRWGSSGEDLRRDFIADFGRLPDGAAVAKVPGLSIDNGAYNIVFANVITGNFGGGVKMVRTAYYNLVGLNSVTENNEGRSEKFHFFGVELGAARADVPVPDLNFTPSRGNIVFSNMIRGGHYAGVFFALGSDLNDVFDNTIFGASNWALESAARQNNSTLNNLTNLPSRNVSAGIDPRLSALTAAHYD